MGINMEFTQEEMESLLYELQKFAYMSGLISDRDVIISVREVYFEHPITVDKEKDKKEWQRQFLKRNAYLSAKKKVLKRQLVAGIVNSIVERFKMKETSFCFFMNICKEILGRKVEKKFVLDNFANRIKDGDEFVKRETKRTASSEDRIFVPYTPGQLLDLTMLDHKVFRETNYRFVYTENLAMIERVFSETAYDFATNAEYLAPLIADYEKMKIEKTMEENAKTNPDFYMKKEIKRL